MKNKKTFLIAIVFTLFIFYVQATYIENRAHCSHVSTDFSAVLLEMMKCDQEIRAKLIGRNFYNTALMHDCSNVDKHHTALLKTLIEQNGYPTIALVGKEASYAAWLLIQHADHDLVFQKEMLISMSEHIKTDNINKKNYAYLADRVACAENKPQLYGTQLDGEFNVLPLQDPLSVDELRKEIGLQPLAEYINVCKQMYH